ncbi:MAG: hypothetical protein HUJ68_06995 [Clostridia bacterium]|nr:hypothetical protein [Clostridia bacterium]
MKNTDVLNMLDNIERHLAKKEYQEVSDYITRKKIEVNIDKDVSSDYIDKLVKDLK